MESRLAYYDVEGCEDFQPEIRERFGNHLDPWSSSISSIESAMSWIRERFGKHLSRGGVPCFKNGDEAEAEFVRFCQEKGIRAYRKSLLAYSGKGPCNRPFYYLSVKDSRDYGLESFRLTCEGGDGRRCLSRVDQISPIAIEPRTAKLLDKNDILIRNWPISPKVYLITKRLKELLQLNDASGCSFRVCVVAESLQGRSPAAIADSMAELEAHADYFQLCIVSKVLAPPHVGLIPNSKGCPKCKCVDIVTTEFEPYFLSGALSSIDFQYFDEFLGENTGCLRLSGEGAIVSGRMLRLLLESGVKGFGRRYTDPPVKFQVVEVRDNDSETSRAA